MKLLVLWTCSPTSFESQHLFVSLSLLFSFVAHLETSTKLCSDRFQHDKHATKNSSGLAITSRRSDCNPRGRLTAASIQNASNKRWQQATTEPNRSKQLPTDHGQIDAGLEASSRYPNAAPSSAGSFPTKHNRKRIPRLTAVPLHPPT